MAEENLFRVGFNLKDQFAFEARHRATKDGAIELAIALSKKFGGASVEVEERRGDKWERMLSIEAKEMF